MGKSKFKIGDNVKVISHPLCNACQYGDIGIVIDVSPWEVQYDGKTRSAYTVRFKNNLTWTFYSYDLELADIDTSENEIYGPYGYVPNFNKEEEKFMFKNSEQNTINKSQDVGVCKYCGVPFEEIEESEEEPGTCEYCIEQRHLIPEVNLRKACNVDLNKFSPYGHEGDWLEVTEWTNHEGFDVTIHYANDHDETDHNFKLSYDELSAIINIVNKFGMLPPIFTKKPEE